MGGDTIMNITDFITSPELKYAVITKEAYDNDPVAQSITQHPRVFVYEGVELVVLSLSKYEVQQLYDYVQGVVEYELTLGTGKVTLFLRGDLEPFLLDTTDSE